MKKITLLLSIFSYLSHSIAFATPISAWCDTQNLRRATKVIADPHLRPKPGSSTQTMDGFFYPNGGKSTIKIKNQTKQQIQASQYSESPGCFYYNNRLEAYCKDKNGKQIFFPVLVRKKYTEDMENTCGLLQQLAKNIQETQENNLYDTNIVSTPPRVTTNASMFAIASGFSTVASAVTTAILNTTAPLIENAENSTALISQTPSTSLSDEWKIGLFIGLTGGLSGLAVCSCLYHGFKIWRENRKNSFSKKAEYIEINELS